jgi:polyisoprenoid-binding protein YceI
MVSRTFQFRSAVGGVALALALTSMSSALRAEPRTLNVDLTHTSINWVIGHGGFSKVPYQFRKIDKFELVFDPDEVSNSKVSVSVEAASLDSNHFYRDNFTRSEVFLDARKFKDITFESTKISKTGDNTGTMTGDMTIKDVTKPVTFDVVFNKSGKHLSGKYMIDGFTATGTIKRSDFGVKAFLPWVGDEIEITIMAEGHH